ncbi:non-specific serine/threonine protein kinase [Salvia divinorum]|uniref:Non-specific serine/threonine protein kinase n=1 Tax=Salvia divinorum TaxID=28513 RepID=A0ABD1FHP2_SALDI
MVSLMFNLANISLKLLGFTALVRISANCSSDQTNGNSIIPPSSFSLMKWRSTSTCLVLSCCTGFSDILIAALLSQNNLLLRFGEKPISVISNLLSHMISMSSLLMPRISASALDKATTFCFLLLQVTRLPPMNMKYPPVDFLSTGLLAQSASV